MKGLKELMLPVGNETESGERGERIASILQRLSPCPYYVVRSDASGSLHSYSSFIRFYMKVYGDQQTL